MDSCEYFFLQAEDGIRYYKVTGVQTCALPIWRRRAGQQSGDAADRDTAAQRGDERLRRGPDTDHQRASRHLAVVDDQRLHATATRPQRADGRALTDHGAARRRRLEERSNQAGRVEPGLSGVEGDLAHVIADGQRRLQRPGALTTDPLRGVATTREPLDTSAKLPLLLVALGPFERPARVMAGVAPELARQLAVRGH